MNSVAGPSSALKSPLKSPLRSPLVPPKTPTISFENIVDGDDIDVLATTTAPTIQVQHSEDDSNRPSVDFELPHAGVPGGEKEQQKQENGGGVTVVAEEGGLTAGSAQQDTELGNSNTRNDFASTQREAVTGEVEKVTQTSANKLAEALSIEGRSEGFTAYNHATQDPAKLIPLVQALRDVAPIPDNDFDSLNAQREMHVFEADNRATTILHDVLGFNSKTQDLKHNGPALLDHTDDDHIVYRAGRHITVASLVDRGERRTLPSLGDKSFQVYAYCVSTDGKYIAISERRPESNVVSLYRIDSGALVSTLATKYLTNTPVICLSMSSNNRFLVTVTAAPEHKLFLWHLEDSQVVGMCEDMTNTPVERISFNGWDSSRMVSSSAKGIVHWTHRDRTLKPVCLLDDPSRHAVALFAQPYGSHHHDQQTNHMGEEVDADIALPQVRGVAPSPLNMSGIGSSPLTPSGGISYDHGGFVATLWYDEDGSVALTSDGWLVATEENDRITYCKKVALPPRAYIAGREPPPATNVGSPRRENNNTSYSAVNTTVQGDTSFIVPDRSLAAIAQQPSMFFQQQELLADQGTDDEFDDYMPAFTHIVVVSRGVIVGTENNTFIILDRTFETNVFHQVATFCCGGDGMGKLSGMSVSPGELNFVVSTTDNKMYKVGLDVLDDAIHEARMDKEYLAARARDDEIFPVNYDEFSSTFVSPSPASLHLKGRNNNTNNNTAILGNGGSDCTMSSVGIEDEEYLFGRGLDRRPPLPEDCIDLCEGPKWENLFEVLDNVSLHSSTITSMSLCLQRPIIATSSFDHRVQIYNYLTHKVIASIALTDPVNCCTLHPMGTHIVIAEDFATNVYAILEHTISLVLALPIRNVLGARYSVSGGRIAFSIGNRVFIYCAASYASLGMLVGHTNMIKSLRWSEDDYFIITSDVVGSIMKWNSQTFKREASECNHRGIATMCALAPNNSSTFAAIGSTRHAKGAMLFDGEMTIVASRVVDGEPPQTVYIRPGFQYPQATSRKMHTSPMAFAHLSQTLFVGTPVGKVLLYSWPLYSFSRPYAMLESHHTEVLHIEISHDEQLLFTAGADGVMFMYNLTHMKGGRYMKISTFDFDVFSEVFLTDSRARVAVKDVSADNEARERIETLTEEMEASEASLKRAHARKVEKLTAKTESICDEIMKEIKRENAKVAQAVLTGRSETFKQDTSRSEVLEGIESSYGRLTLEAQRRYEALHAEKETLVLQFEKAHTMRVAKWDEERTAMEVTRINRERELSAKVEDLRGMLKDQEQVRAAVLDITLLDGEQEVANLKAANDNQLNYLLENLQTVHQMQIGGEREANRLDNEIRALKEDLIEKEHVLNRIENNCEAQRSENTNLRGMNKVKQNEINATEKRMQQLRQQLLSLENLRFVLTHQLDNLQGEVEPKEAKLVQLDKAVLEREKMLQAVYKSRTRLVDKSGNAERALKKGVTSYTHATSTFNRKKYDVGSVLADITRAVEMDAGDGSRLKRSLIELVGNNQKRLPVEKDHNKNNAEALATMLNDRKQVEEEIRSHNEFLSQVLNAENRINGISKREVESSNRVVLGSNISMIEEIKDLQQSGRQETQRLRLLERKLRDARVTLQHLGDARRNMLNEERRSLAASAESTPATRQLSLSSAAAQSKADVPLQPPSASATLSALSTHNRSKFSGGTGTIGGAKRPASLPPLKNSNSSTSGAGVGASGSQKASSASGSLAGGKVAVSKQRAQLEALVAQLDDGSDRMRSRQVEAHRLRMMVHELLTNEEKRLEVALADTSEALASNTSATDRFVHLTSGDTSSILRMAAESRMSGGTRTGMSMYTPGPQDYDAGFSSLISDLDSPQQHRGGEVTKESDKNGKKVGTKPFSLHNRRISSTTDDNDAHALLDPDVEVVRGGVGVEVSTVIPQLSNEEDTSIVPQRAAVPSAATARPMTPPTGLPV